jgi:hypothetical protein
VSRVRLLSDYSADFRRVLMLSLATVPVGVPVHIRDDLLLRQRLSLTASYAEPMCRRPRRRPVAASQLLHRALQRCDGRPSLLGFAARQRPRWRWKKHRVGARGSTGQLAESRVLFFLVASARVLFLGRFFSWVLFLECFLIKHPGAFFPWVLFNKAPGCFIGVCEKAPDCIWR